MKTNPNIGKECILVKGVICDDCGACDMCDIDPNKRCDNCMKCLDLADYNGIIVDKIEAPKKK